MRNLLIAMLGIGILDSCVAEDVSSSDGLYVGLGMSIIHDKLQSDFISVPTGQLRNIRNSYSVYDSTGKTSYVPVILWGWSCKFDMPLFVALEASYSFANSKHSTLQDCTGVVGTPLAMSPAIRNYKIGSEIRGVLKVGYKAQNYAAYVIGGISGRNREYVFMQPNMFDDASRTLDPVGVTARVSLSPSKVVPVVGVGVRYACRGYAVSFEVSKVWNRSASRVTKGVDPLDAAPHVCKRFHSVKVKNNIDMRLAISKSVNMF